MRSIQRGPEPQSLAAARREVSRIERETGRPHGDPWSELKDKAPVVDALREAQRGLCAYCCDRLVPGRIRVEHFVPRSKAPEMALTWDNLLAVCDGGDVPGGRARGEFTCDRHRTPYSPGPPERGLLHVSPARPPPDPGEVFHVELSSRRLGEMTASTPDAAADLTELNLNAARLTRARRDVIEVLRRQLHQAGERDTRVLLRHQQVLHTTAGDLPAFAHVLEAYVGAKLRRRGFS